MDTIMNSLPITSEQVPCYDPSYPAYYSSYSLPWMPHKNALPNYVNNEPMFYKKEEQPYPPPKKLRLQDEIVINRGYAYPLPQESGKFGESNVLEDTTNKLLGLKRKAGRVLQNDKRKKCQDSTNKMFEVMWKTEGEQQNKKGIKLQSSTKKVLRVKRKAAGAPQDEKTTKLRYTTSGISGGKRKAEGAPQDEKATKLRDTTNKILGVMHKSEGTPKVKKARKIKKSTKKVLGLKQKAKRAPLNEKITKLRDSTKKVKGVKRKAEGVPQGEKPMKKRYTFREYMEAAQVNQNKTNLIQSTSKCSLSQVLKTDTEEVTNIHKETETDQLAVAEYAKEVFQYYKDREHVFQIDKYIHRHPGISKSMRAILVDWMVEVQQSFELSHGTLYFAVKIVDLFLSKTVYIPRDVLQLVGSTSIFIACKFDEPLLPCVSDYLYICDDVYNRNDMISMEIKILITTGFDLGVPLSYTFLRRYARCGKVCKQDLFLARYILELSLMDYELIGVLDSMLASAALFLAKAIKGDKTWNQTLAHYSGYKIKDIRHIVCHLHNMLCQPPKNHLKAIRKKYSHKVLFEVAKTTIPETLDI